MKFSIPKDKSTTWVIVALVTLVVAYFFGSRTGKAATVTGGKTVKTAALTYDLAQYSAFADKLFDAMFRLNDSENAVYTVFNRLRTESDLFQVMKAFGNRRLMFTIGTADLSTWINRKLNASEIEKVNEILQRNNIDYQF